MPAVPALPDPALALRLATFAATDGIDPRVVDQVRAEIDHLALPPGRCTDEVLGSFVSHLVQALNRAVHGTALTTFDAQDVIDAVIAERPGLLDRAAALARRAEDALGITLPDTEVRILCLHLGTISATDERTDR